MRVASLTSGGKDSIYSTYLASKKHEIKYLVTIIPKRKDSYMYHAYGLEIIDLVAKAIGIPLIKRKTSGIKEKELEDLKEALESVKDGIDGVVSGAIASVYQKTRIDRICNELGLKSLAPLWHRDPEVLLKEQVSLGFKAIIIVVAAQGFTKDWLGRKIDFGCIEELKKLNKKYGINISGEGGDYESLVLDAPMFKKRIKLVDTEKIWNGMSGYLKIKKANLIPK